MSLDYPSLRNAVAGLTAQRSLVEQFYSGVLAELRQALPDEPWPSSFLAARTQGRKLAAAVQPPPNPADTGDALALALLGLNHPDAIFDCLAAAIAEGLFDPPGADAAAQEASRKAASEALKAAFAAEPPPPPPPAPPPPGSTAEQQKSTHRGATFPDPALMIPAFMLAKKRICRIATSDRDGAPITGTGFLIGPSAVLTNHHVVRSKLENPTIPLTVMFDFSQLTGASTGNSSVFEVGRDKAGTDWCLHLSPAGAEAGEKLGAGWWMDDVEREAWIGRHGPSLDYAVLAIRGAPGLQRGWYDLTKLTPPPKDIGCEVLQHPEGRGFARESGRLHFPTRTTRLFHSASTRSGSSGGLVIDAEGRPIGLHYLGLDSGARATPPDPRVPQEVVNVAIPLLTIAADLGPNKLAALQAHPSLVPARGCLQGGKPLFGRQELLGFLPLLATGERRILWIKPPAEARFQKPGKSFTVDILETLFPPPHHLFRRLGADQVPVDERALAAMLIEDLTGTPPQTLPEPATTDAAFDSVLASVVAAASHTAAQRHLVWLVIDELDKIDIPDSGGARFLDRLYARIADIDRLRIVLIGMRNTRSQIPEKLLAKNEIVERDVSEIKAMFADWLDRRTVGGQPIDSGVTGMLGELAQSFAGTTAPLETISRFVVAHLNEPLKQYVDR